MLGEEFVNFLRGATVMKLALNLRADARQYDTFWGGLQHGIQWKSECAHIVQANIPFCVSQNGRKFAPQNSHWREGQFFVML